MNPQERGVRKAYPDLRCGVTIPRLKGIVRKPDPSAIPDENFWEMVNARIWGGRVHNRGGQSKVNSGGVTSGCPELIFDGGDIGANDPQVLSTDLFFALETGNNLSKIDTSHAVSEVVAEGVSLQAVTKYGGYLYYRAGLSGGTYTFRRVALSSLAAENTFTVTQLNANDRGPMGGVVVGGKFWFLYSYHFLLSPTNGRIYSWDGATVTSENSFSYADTSSTFNPNAVESAEFQGGVVFADASSNVSGSTRFIYRNAAGTLSYPAFLVAFDPVLGRMSEFGTKLYIPGSSQIYSFDGTTVASAHSPSGAVMMGPTCVFGDYLYYVYKITGDSARLGRTDGATFTDNYATIGTIEGEFSDLIEHNGSLYLLTNADGGIVGRGVWKSTGSDLTAWTNVYTATGALYPAATGNA